MVVKLFSGENRTTCAKFTKRHKNFYGIIMARQIRKLIADLEDAGFALVSGGKGSHRKFRHPRFSGAVILSGKDREDAHHYQEKQVRNAIREVTR